MRKKEWNKDHFHIVKQTQSDKLARSEDEDEKTDTKGIVEKDTRTFMYMVQRIKH